MIRVLKVKNTGGACPSQWEGITDDDRAVYVRYRWGYLSVCVGKAGDHTEFAGVEGEEVYGEQVGGGFDGVMDYTELIEHTKDVIEFPERETRQ